MLPSSTMGVGRPFGAPLPAPRVWRHPPPRASARAVTHPPDTQALGTRVFRAGPRHRLTRPVAQWALQKATRLLALALGDGLRELRDSSDPLVQAHVNGQEHRTLARLLAEVVELLGVGSTSSPRGADRTWPRSSADASSKRRRSRCSPPMRTLGRSVSSLGAGGGLAARQGIDRIVAIGSSSVPSSIVAVMFVHPPTLQPRPGPRRRGIRCPWLLPRMPPPWDQSRSQGRAQPRPPSVSGRKGEAPCQVPGPNLDVLLTWGDGVAPEVVDNTHTRAVGVVPTEGVNR